MKYLRIICLTALLPALSGVLLSQEMPADSVVIEKKPAAKQGWSVIPFPNLGYTTDAGLNLGVLINLYDYGRGADNIYPRRHQHLCLSGVYTTKGAWYIHTYYDTRKLIPGVRMTAAATYKQAVACNFYGYNGIASPYHPEWDINKGHLEAFYSIRRRTGRLAVNFQGDIVGGLKWLAGTTFRYFGLEDYRRKSYVEENTLYRLYQDAGLIRPDEASGGMLLEARAGIIFDTRNHDEAPTRGMYGELYVLGNADLRAKHYHYGKIVAHWRHYIPMAKERLVFAYHLGYQGIFAGEQPFFMLQDISTLYPIDSDFEGLGSYRTLRGTMFNRILADSYAWANVELRIKLFQFNFLRQHFDVFANPFVDAGAIADPFRLQEQRESGNELIYSGKEAWVHGSAGLGLKVHVNQSMVISFEVARAFNPALVKGVGIAVTTGYIF